MVFESLRFVKPSPCAQAVRHRTSQHGHNASVKDAESNQNGTEQHQQPHMRQGMGTAFKNPCHGLPPWQFPTAEMACISPTALQELFRVPSPAACRQAQAATVLTQAAHSSMTLHAQHSIAHFGCASPCTTAATGNACTTSAMVRMMARRRCMGDKDSTLQAFLLWEETNPAKIS